MGNIRLSPKHGLNPSLGMCFYCQEENGEVIVPGQLHGDVEAPRKAVWHRDPCAGCKGLMEKGIILISVKTGESGDNPYRTGGWCALKEEAVIRMVSDTKLLEHILKARVVFLPDEVWDLLGLPRGEVPGVPTRVEDVRS